jgi:hypothetical protein
MRRLSILCMFSLISLCGCDEVPLHWFSAPQTVTADGQVHLACEGVIRVYSPSRDIKASSSSKSYEVVFTDEYGQSQDLTDLTSYTISDAPKDAHYAMGPATPENLSKTYSDGTPMQVGGTVLFSEGKSGRAIWHGSGKWSPIPCH